MPVDTWSNCRCCSYCNVGVGWFAPEVLNGGLEALLFNFKELPLCNVAGLDEPTQDLSFTEVDLSIMEPEVITTAPIPPPFQPLNLCVTLWWPSTYTSRGPWNSCSGLPPQPQPPSLNTACLGGSHHLWPWGLHPPPEQKILPGSRGWTQPSLIHWPPPHRHPHVWPSQKTSLASSYSVTHHPWLSWWKLQRWPASPLLHSLRLPPGQIQPTYQMRSFDCKWRWMCPWSGSSWLRPLWTPTKEIWHWMLILPCTTMRHRLPRPSKRWKSTVQLQSRRQRLIMLSRSALCINLTRRAC